jgi:hypothetical protein
VKPEQEVAFADFVATRSAAVRRLALAMTGDYGEGGTRSMPSWATDAASTPSRV